MQIATAPHRTARQAANDRLRQRYRVHLERGRALEQRASSGIALIEPGEPMQNGYIESFDGRMRDELLNESRCDALKAAALL
jgi:Integrase core domain